MASKQSVLRSKQTAIVDESENRSKQSHHLKKTAFKKFAANFSGTQNNGKKYEELSKSDYKMLLKEKDEQIEKLEERLKLLHNCNVQYAAENRSMETRKCEACLPKNCQVDCLSKKLSQITHENCLLKDDVKMMKTLIYRLNVEIERYQDTLGQNKTKVYRSSEVNKNEGSVIDWGPVNTHTLAPLLEAYTEMINEKCDLVNHYENEFHNLTGQMKQIVEENEKLHHELDIARRQNESWITDKMRLEAQSDICRCKAEVQTKRADLAKEKLVEIVRCYEQKIQSQSLELERLQDGYNRAKVELGALRFKQNEPEIGVNGLNESKKLSDELKEQHKLEMEQYQTELKELREKLKETEQQYQCQKRKFEELNEKYQKQFESNINLNNKITALRQNLGRLRLTRESLRNKLKTFSSPVKLTTDRSYQKCRCCVAPVESRVQPTHMHYLNEIEKLANKLIRRDETLKQVLQATTTKKKK